MSISFLAFHLQSLIFSCTWVFWVISYTLLDQHQLHSFHHLQKQLTMTQQRKKSLLLFSYLHSQCRLLLSHLSKVEMFEGSFLLWCYLFHNHHTQSAIESCFKIPYTLLFICISLTQISITFCLDCGKVLLRFNNQMIILNVILSIPCISFFLDLLLLCPKHFIMIHKGFHNQLLTCFFNLIHSTMFLVM